MVLPGVIGHFGGVGALPEQFAAAKPFPHRIIDGFFPDDLIDRAWEEFPPPAAECWRTFVGDHEAGKQECSSPLWHGEATRILLGALVSEDFTRFLEIETGISDLRVDLVGGGMHQSPPGARLGMHVDFNRHPLTGTERVLNVLLFLNRGWPTEHAGGMLYLGKPDEKGSVAVAPIANRLVIFRTSDHSWHGHPLPVPDGVIRRSLAAYFYRPVGDDPPEEHSTVWAD